MAFLKHVVTHEDATVPTLNEVRELATTIIRHFKSHAMIHTYLRNAFGAKTLTVPILFETVGHFNAMKHYFEFESVEECDVMPLLDYAYAVTWLQTNGDDIEFAQCVYGIKHVVTMGRGGYALVDSMPASLPLCYVCRSTNIRTPLNKCGRCKCFWYCGRECQLTHWLRGGHDKDCVAYARCLKASVDKTRGDNPPNLVNDQNEGCESSATDAAPCVFELKRVRASRRHTR